MTGTGRLARTPMTPAAGACHARGREPDHGIGANERHHHGEARGHGVNRGGGHGVTGEGHGQGNRRDHRHGPGRPGNDGHAHLTPRPGRPLSLTAAAGRLRAALRVLLGVVDLVVPAGAAAMA